MDIKHIKATIKKNDRLKGKLGWFWKWCYLFQSIILNTKHFLSKDNYNHLKWVLPLIVAITIAIIKI